MNTTSTTKQKRDPKRAVPILLFVFIFCLIIDNAFKMMTKPMAEGLGIPDNEASLQASLAGIIIGIGAVVYAALADSIPIRKLMLTGVILVVAGSAIAFVFSSWWPAVLAGRLIQTTGLAAAETLYVIYVTKHLTEEDQKTYLGFSAAAFQTGLLFGALSSGFVSTYVSWTAMLAIPVILVLTVPAIVKMVPEEEATAGRLDAWGLLFIAVFATALILYMQSGGPLLILLAAVGIVAFVVRIRAAEHPVVKPSFFANGRYAWTLVLVLFLYSTQLGMVFLVPYATEHYFGFTLNQANLLMAPGYACAIVVAVSSGRIARVLTSRQTIYVGFGLIVGALAVSAAALDAHVALFGACLIAFPCGYAIIYAPLLDTALTSISAANSGIAIGFYNLTINIAVPLGIAYTSRLLTGGLDFHATLWVLAAISALGATIYAISDFWLARRERAATRVA